MSQNKQAFLDMIAWSEGTDNGRQPTRNHGYDVIVGGALFTNYADHPRVLVHLNAHLESTAAGRYQILAKFYDAYKKQLDLPDFGPASQDAIAWQLIGECKARTDIEIGNFDIAVHKCASRWASLPGNDYGQHQNHIDDLRRVYTDHGGKVGSA